MITFYSEFPIDMGYLPGFFSEADPRPAREQLHENYAHGGGWRPMKGWVYDSVTHTIMYPADAEYYSPLAIANLREEALFFYQGAWLLILQPDGSFEIGRVD